MIATLGGALVLQLRHGKAPKQAPKRTPEAILRDHFAALVADRYDDLQVLAVVALGKRKADELLPALRSMVARSGGPAPEEKPAEEPADEEPT